MPLTRQALLICAALLPLSATPPAHAQPQGKVGEYSDAAIEGAVLEPTPVVVSGDGELAKLIEVPDGFRVQVLARHLGNTRMLARHGEHVYATCRTEGDVIRLDDADGDGLYEGHTVVAARPGMHGITSDGHTVFLATVNEIYTAPVNGDGTFGNLTRIIDDLPDGGQHPNRTIAIGPDGMLWITAGSNCNACNETNQESASILRAKKDGTSRTIFARGLRNTIGFGFEPTTGELYGADHGIDWLGDEEQQEEFNRIQQGRRYGWPYSYDFSRFNPQDNPPKGITLEQWAKLSSEPVLGYTAHSAPMQMVFYTGAAFPEEYRGDAFIAMRGSWNRRPPSGYEITRVDFEGGKPKSWDHFAEGFLIEDEGGGYGFLGRLARLTELADGALLLAYDFNGILYRISYDENESAQNRAQTSRPDVMPKPPVSDLAINLVDAPASRLAVSGDFPPDGQIPIEHAAEGHNASPALSWSGTPEETRSFALVVDDPDADEPKPFTHWAAWDTLGNLEGLREGLPTDLVLQDPEGMRQGTNSKGQTGYLGPRPPRSDPPHHYHFQLFALDAAQLDLEQGPTREELLKAMEGHVLAEGKLAGQYQRPAPEKPAD